VSTEAVERVRALAQFWASLPHQEDRRADIAAEVDRHVGERVLGMLDSSAVAKVALSRVTALAESWIAPGGLGLYYPAAGQAVLDAIRGAPTETEATWRERAEAAERKLASLRSLAEGCRELASNGRDLDRNCTASAAYRAAAGDMLAITGTEGEGRD
jgi:hypothetical protein